MIDVLLLQKLDTNALNCNLIAAECKYSKNDGQACSDNLYKYCTLAIDEISIMENIQCNFARDRYLGLIAAAHCTTIISQGIFAEWK